MLYFKKASVFFIKFGLGYKGRAIRYIFCSAKASQKDTASIPHAKNNTMNFYKKVILISTLFSLMSCEKFYISSIVNNSKNEITVKVKIDNDAVDKKRKEYLEKGYLFDKENPKDYEIKIKSLESYDLDGSMHTEPDFYEIKEIEIYSGDTLILKCRNDQMQKLFSTVNTPGHLDLIIN